MFDPKKEVPNLELCKQLKELGFPQEGMGWYWGSFEEPNDKYYLCFRYAENRLVLYGGLAGTNENCVWDAFNDPPVMIKAPTCRELGEWLPDIIIVKSDEPISYFIKYQKNKWRYRYVDKHGRMLNTEFIEADTEPNARAKMLIWLAKNNYIKFNKGDNDA